MRKCRSSCICIQLWGYSNHFNLVASWKAFRSVKQVVYFPAISVFNASIMCSLQIDGISTKFICPKTLTIPSQRIRSSSYPICIFQPPTKNRNSCASWALVFYLDQRIGIYRVCPTQYNTISRLWGGKSTDLPPKHFNRELPSSVLRRRTHNFFMDPRFFENLSTFRFLLKKSLTWTCCKKYGFTHLASQWLSQHGIQTQNLMPNEWDCAIKFTIAFLSEVISLVCWSSCYGNFAAFWQEPRFKVLHYLTSLDSYNVVFWARK